MSQQSLRVIYFSYFHSIMSYGITFWRKSLISNNTVRLQKKVIRIIMNIRSRDSCREQFRKLQILPLQSQHIFSLLLIVINSSDMFEHDCEIHTINTAIRTNLHLPPLRLTRCLLFWHHGLQQLLKYQCLNVWTPQMYTELSFVGQGVF
jgi:hypothetical protein